MESNPMSSGGIYSNVQSGMLGLEMSLHHPVPPQNPPNPHRMPPQPPPQSHHPMVAYGHHEGDYHQQPPQTTKQNYPFSAKSKNQSLTLSDDEEPGFAAETSAADDGKRKMSPWQRMKWTDNMVRLLIMVVYYIGDEVSSEGNDSSGKKKGGGVLQKKGKWKSVSQAMMERGFYVSPQQCEDKFNDLNKRYKRVNDILGKGTSCRVVENQSLLDTMDHLSPKTKEEVKKLLNSKHLFFREMCAYHNSCGHGSGGGGGGGGGGGSGGVQNSPPEVAAQPPQRCLHSSENERAKLGKGIEDEDDDDENDEDIEDEDDEDEDDEDDDVDTDERSTRKKMKRGTLTLSLQSPLMQQLEVEVMNVFQDGTKGPMEKRQWMKAKIIRLEEQRVGIQTQAFELEKQRLKWLKFSAKKEREMEREKIANEKVKLENERMVLLVRQKELDLMEFQQRQQQQQYSSNKKGDPSSITG